MPDANTDASEKIDARIQEFDDWRGETLSRVRQVILGADPEIVEEWKWQKATSPGVAVWSRSGGWRSKRLGTGTSYSRWAGASSVLLGEGKTDEGRERSCRREQGLAALQVLGALHRRAV